MHKSYQNSYNRYFQQTQKACKSSVFTIYFLISGNRGCIHSLASGLWTDGQTDKRTDRSVDQCLSFGGAFTHKYCSCKKVARNTGWNTVLRIASVIYRVGQKGETTVSWLKRGQISTDFQFVFTGRFRGKFALKRLRKSHHTVQMCCHTTRETLMSEKKRLTINYKVM